MDVVGSFRLSALSLAALTIALGASADFSPPRFVRTTADCVLLRKAVPDSLDDRANTVCTDRGYGWEVVEPYSAKSGQWFRVRNLVTTDTGWLASWYTEPFEIRGVTLTAPPPSVQYEKQSETERLTNDTMRIANETARIEREAARENRAANHENALWMRLAYMAGICAAIAGIIAATMTAIAYGRAARIEDLKFKDRVKAREQTVVAEPGLPIPFPTEEWRAARNARRERRRSPKVYHGTSADGPWSIPAEKVQDHEH